MSDHRLRIEVAGSIASGKTTLVSRLEAAGFSVAFERFRDNPFWKVFHDDPVRYAFETECTFLLQHYHTAKSIPAQPPLVCDFSFVLDEAYAKMSLESGQLRAFRAVQRQAAVELGRPVLTIHLVCEPDELLRRVRARCRPEEASITVDFLSVLGDRVSGLLADESSSLQIDSNETNFADDADVCRDVVALIRAAYSNEARRLGLPA